jgi:hypothetical protein
MLSLDECRKLLESEGAGPLTDDEVRAARDALYGLARLCAENPPARSAEAVPQEKEAKP